jgi:hypothetical protein
MADAPTKKVSAFALATTSSVADSIPIIQSGANKRIHPGSTGGLDADLLDGYQASTLYIPRGYIDGLICSNAADTEYDITIAAGQARDSTNVMPLILSSAITKRIDAAWAAGTGGGGMDTGSVANSTVYYIWLIRKDSDGTIDALFSLSKTAPTMPSGYTYKRRIMSLITDSSAKIINFTQTDGDVRLNQPIQDRASAALANTNRTAYANSAPPSMMAILSIDILSGTLGTVAYFWFGPSTRPDAAASATNRNILCNLTNSTDVVIAYIVNDASRQIYARGSSTAINLCINTLGWIDDRGRDA